MGIKKSILSYSLLTSISGEFFEEVKVKDCHKTKPVKEYSRIPEHILKEYNLIKHKKSNLSRRERDYIIMTVDKTKSSPTSNEGELNLNNNS